MTMQEAKGDDVLIVLIIGYSQRYAHLHHLCNKHGGQVIGCLIITIYC